jgi:hypothetical protein
MVLAGPDIPKTLSVPALPGTILGLLLEIVNLQSKCELWLDPGWMFMLELGTLF